MTENLQADCVQSRRAGFIQRFLNSLTTVGTSEEVTVAGTVVAVSRLISGLEESTENPHKITLLLDFSHMGVV